MVYGIVRQSGGDVSVLSERHRGTTFRIYLPEATATADTAGLAPPAGETLPRGSETVLVVEDEEQLKDLTCRMLRDQGYEVLSTTEARQALEICGAYPGPIHLMVTDMVMPRMGGAELAETARTLRAEMRVLYMSGYTDSATLNGGGAETVPFLQKPFTALELGRRVREALGTAAVEGNGAVVSHLRNAR
jgi:DNA-binding NtrC family response regulator